MLTPAVPWFPTPKVSLWSLDWPCTLSTQRSEPSASLLLHTQWLTQFSTAPVPCAIARSTGPRRILFVAQQMKCLRIAVFCATEWFSHRPSNWTPLTRAFLAHILSQTIWTIAFGRRLTPGPSRHCNRRILGVHIRIEEPCDSQRDLYCSFQGAQSRRERTSRKEPYVSS